MDYKYFHDGLLSLSVVQFVFSLTLLLGSIILKPYIALEPDERDFIILLALVNLVFSFYYLIEALKLESVFSLEEKHIFKFGKRIGVISLLYTPHLFVFISLLFIDLHDLQLMMVILNLIIETLLLGIVFKEIYDILFKEETERKFELEQNRKLYFEKK
ncbi:MAG TPA: hypothetical protein VMV43_10160 [Candidatus Nanopelagicaceae bacterium]|jgi:hypothetical protein|nr:hypothetical protein [Candidatus Nanopelagicaceae bacterium]